MIESTSKHKQIRPIVGELMRKVLAGGNVVTLPPILYWINEMFPDDKVEDALRWLIRKGITGNNFEEWFVLTCDKSTLELQRHLLRGVERERHLRRLFPKDLKA